VGAWNVQNQLWCDRWEERHSSYLLIILRFPSIVGMCILDTLTNAWNTCRIRHQPRSNDQFIPNTYIHLSIPFPFFSQQDFATPSKKPAQATLHVKIHSRNLLNQLPTYPITLHTIRKNTPNRALQPFLGDTNTIPIFIADPAHEKWVWFLFQIGCLVAADIVHDIAASVGFRCLLFEKLVYCFHLYLS
jgi:hypothetical protein